MRSVNATIPEIADGAVRAQSSPAAAWIEYDYQSDAASPTVASEDALAPRSGLQSTTGDEYFPNVVLGRAG